MLTTSQFKRDVRRTARRGRDLDELWAVVEQLASGQPLDPRRRPHRLSGDWPDCWECHIRPDWLLIWRQERDSLILVRTGTHADLFD
ncbi:MAG: type II toxin-antitoxin system YafQ family toxin [bacterium]|nr:type II toxin-antitoxin system YafQ family toxin [bacterium]MCY3952532.1 type II toxin-antitoxin system YafQ family toxin [bacterium]MCY4101715.1 type II toxin-antitoxin system YafQ family toxin [bacterium]